MENQHWIQSSTEKQSVILVGELVHSAGGTLNLRERRDTFILFSAAIDVLAVMGKQKRQRRKPHKENAPTGLSSVQEFESNEELTDGDREKILQNVYDDVSSDDVL